MKILVVGAVAGGATALARLRRLDEKAEIIVFERGGYISYANCGLPYYIGKQIKNRDSLFVSDKDTIEAKYAVEIRLNSNVYSIDRENKTVTVKNSETGEEYKESYDKLLLSTGSSPFVPNPSWLEQSRVFKLWTIPDTDKIYEFVGNHTPKRAVIVGGGFIGLEMAENLSDRGVEVSLCDMADQVMPPIDKDMAKIVEVRLAEKGVHLYLGNGLKDIDNDGSKVLLADGTTLETDLVILSIGVKPNSQIAEAAGLELNARRGIRVDEYMRTSDENIYAVGDVIGVQDYMLGGEVMIPLAGPANKQGRNVAENMLGLGEKTYDGTLGTSVAKIFDMTVASTGASEKSLNRAGKVYGEDYYISLVHPMSHAGYYPGATPMTIKLIFDRDGKVLGAQIVGYGGVDKRIDTISTLLHFHGTVSDLANLELAYAPPYSSAKDPVNFAGYTAENILADLAHPLRVDELDVGERNEYVLLDVREEIEVMANPVEGAIHIPLTQLRNKIDELDHSKSYVTLCAVGLRGYIAERILRQRGYEAYYLLGGCRTMNTHYKDTSKIKPNAISSNIKDDTSQEKLNSQPGPSSVNTVTLDACGLSCPGPIIKVSEYMNELKIGDELRVTASDPGFAADIENWCQNTGNTLLESYSNGGSYNVVLRRGVNCDSSGNCEGMTCGHDKPIDTACTVKEKTMIVFDGDLDKAIASFIIATGAAAMGNKVHMFFTFWGLSVIRKSQPPKVKKDFLSKMFANMLPKGSRKLKLSHMNMGGMGSKMIRSVMKSKDITSLEDLIQTAINMGVEMTACQMSMDVMGITKAELIDGVKVGGVATMLNNSDRSNMNLFI